MKRYLLYGFVLLAASMWGCAKTQKEALAKKLKELHDYDRELYKQPNVKVVKWIDDSTAVDSTDPADSIHLVSIADLWLREALKDVELASTYQTGSFFSIENMEDAPPGGKCCPCSGGSCCACSSTVLFASVSSMGVTSVGLESILKKFPKDSTRKNIDIFIFKNGQDTVDNTKPLYEDGDHELVITRKKDQIKIKVKVEKGRLRLIDK